MVKNKKYTELQKYLKLTKLYLMRLSKYDEEINYYYIQPYPIKNFRNDICRFTNCLKYVDNIFNHIIDRKKLLCDVLSLIKECYRELRYKYDFENAFLIENHKTIEQIYILNDGFVERRKAYEKQNTLAMLVLTFYYDVTWGKTYANFGKYSKVYDLYTNKIKYLWCAI